MTFDSVQTLGIAILALCTGVLVIRQSRTLDFAALLITSKRTSDDDAEQFLDLTRFHEKLADKRKSQGSPAQ